MSARTKNNVKTIGAADGPVLMLAHGFGCDQGLWSAVAGRLSNAFNIVLFDHVGAGKSDPAAWDGKKYSTIEQYARDVVDIVEELDLRDVVFVGHSVASMIGVVAVAQAPERFAKLILLTPSPRYIDDGDYRGGFTAADIDDLLDSLDSNYLGWSREMAPKIMGTPDRPELGEQLTDSFCRTDPAAARVFARTTFLSDNRADLRRVTLPTLVVDCARDTLAPPAVGKYVHDNIVGSMLQTLDVSGHCPQVSAPAATAEAIAAFAAPA